MDLSKLSTNNWIAGGGGLVSLIAMFLPWYGTDFGGSFGSVTANAWDTGAIGLLPLLGSLLVIAAATILILKVLDVKDVKVAGLTAEQLAMVVAAVGVLFVFLKLLVGEDGIGSKLGLYLGLLSGIAVAAGAFLSGKDLGIGLPTGDDFKSPGGGTGGGSSTF